MCGRFLRFASIQDVAEIFRATPAGEFPAPPTFNAPPQTWQMVIRLSQEGQREIVMMRWGLIPKDWDENHKYSTFNARAEDILTANAFKSAIRARRCLVPVNGYYEWEKFEKGKKQAYAMGMKDGSPFAFAGIWEEWTESQRAMIRRLDAAEERAIKRQAERAQNSGTLFEMNEPEGVDPDTDPTLRRLLTFSVITCDPNDLTEKFHNRMPVILDAKDYDRWLESGDPLQPPVDLLRAFPSELMRVWKVGPGVGNVRNDYPGLMDPI